MTAPTNYPPIAFDAAGNLARCIVCSETFSRCRCPEGFNGTKISSRVRHGIATWGASTCRACGEIPLHCHCAADVLDSIRQSGTDNPSSRLDQLRQALLDSAALDSIPVPQPLIDGILYADTLAWLHGKPGCGKSFVALDWAACIAGGLPWQMHETAQGPVLYVIAEGVSGLRGRVRAWEDYAQQKTAVTFLPVAVQFLDPRDLAAITAIAGELKPVLIVIDTQARVTVGADENSARDMGRFVAEADKLRQASKACVLLVHHEARAGDNMRGSTALEGAAATLIRITKDGTFLRLDCPKQKDAAPFDPIRLRLVPQLGSVTIQSHDGVGLDEEMSASEQKIIGVLRESFGTTGASGSKLFDVAGVAKTSYYRALNRLVTHGAVRNVGTKKRPHYEIADGEATR